MVYVTGGPLEDGLIIQRSEEKELLQHITNQRLYVALCGAVKQAKQHLCFSSGASFRSTDAVSRGLTAAICKVSLASASTNTSVVRLTRQSRIAWQTGRGRTSRTFAISFLSQST